MIAIAVVASLVAYAWVLGYIGGQTQKTGNQIQIQSYTSQGSLILYVQNTAQSTVHLKQDASVYVNDVLYNILRCDNGNGVDQDIATSALIPIASGQTVKITVAYYEPIKANDKIKVVTVEGTFMLISGSNSGSSGNSGNGGSQPVNVQVTFSVSPSGAGTTNPAGTQTYTAGSVRSISATANTGYVFSSWTFSGSVQINNPTSASTTAQINGASTITANFVSSSNPKLAYTAGAAQSLNVNEMSSVITIQRQDASGAAQTSGSLSVSLAKTSSTGIFYSDAAGTSPITSNTITINAGASSGSFYYKDTSAGTSTLTASATGYQPVSTTFTINSPTPTPTPTTSPTPTPTNGPTPTPTPTAQVTFAVNPAGTGTTTPSGTHTYNVGTSVSISATGNTGYTFSSWTFTGSIQVTNPSSASTNAIINGAGIITANFIQAGNNKLSFTAGTSQTLQVNEPSAKITVQRQTSSGTPVTAGSTTISLTATAGAFYFDSACTSQITLVTIDNPQSTADFYYKSSTSGTPTLTASATGYQPVSTTLTINSLPPTAQVTFAVSPAGSGTTNPSGTQTYNVGATTPISATANTGYTFSSWGFNGNIQISNANSASTSAQINGAGTITAYFISATGNKLVFTAGTSQTLSVYEPSAKITVQRQNSAGTPITSGSNTIVSLATTSTGGKFYSDSACTTQITSVTISSGSTKDFYYRDSATGTPTITASASSYQPVSTTLTISAATPEIGLTTGFDGTPWDSEWRSWPNPPWTSATDYYVSGPNSAKATQSTQGAFSSNKVDATGAAYITVSFYYRVASTDQTDFQIRYGATRTDNYDAITWHLIASLGSVVPNQWQYYTVTITDTSAFTDYFRFQFVSQSLSSNAAIWVDNVQIVVNR